MRKISDLSYFWPMLERFLDFIKKHALIEPNERVLLAVSGGVDSMVLLALFHQAGIPCGVAHCNYQLRGADSDADEALVKSRAQALGIPFHSKRFDTKTIAAERKLSTQMAARELRYSFFEQLRKSEGYHKIATAHHLNDSFETVIYNLAKGTSIAGLRGIRPKDVDVIRPLQAFTKDKVKEWARETGVAWREDVSNEETYYRRNFIRHEVMPRLKEINPDLLNTFKNTASRNAEVEALFQKEVIRVVDTVGRDEHNARHLKKSEVSGPLLLQQALKILGLDFNYSQALSIYEAFDSQPGKEFMSNGYRLVVDREELIWNLKERDAFVFHQIQKKDQSIRMGTHDYTMQVVSADMPIKELKKTENALLDLRKLEFPLTVRPWQEGDVFQPLGMRGKKKLSDFMIDRKIPVNLKQHVMVLESAGDIVWVVGLRIDDRYKVTEKTEKIFCLIQQGNV